MNERWCLRQSGVLPYWPPSSSYFRLLAGVSSAETERSRKAGQENQSLLAICPVQHVQLLSTAASFFEAVQRTT